VPAMALLLQLILRVIKYLGVHICTARKFKLNYDVVKASFLEH